MPLEKNTQASKPRMPITARLNMIPRQLDEVAPVNRDSPERTRVEGDVLRVNSTCSRESRWKGTRLHCAWAVL
ncbi:MAG: hypothetical protein ABI577_16510, partial [bacterium]